MAVGWDATRLYLFQLDINRIFGSSGFLIILVQQKSLLHRFQAAVFPRSTTDGS